MMQQDKPDEFVLATGENHTVREFVEKVALHNDFNIVWNGKGIDEKGIDKNSNKVIVSINSKYYRPADVNTLIGDSKKARDTFGWVPTVNFTNLVTMMAEADLKCASN